MGNEEPFRGSGGPQNTNGTNENVLKKTPQTEALPGKRKGTPTQSRTTHHWGKGGWRRMKEKSVIVKRKKKLTWEQKKNMERGKRGKER